MPQSRCGGFVVIGHAAGTEIHKMGSPLEGKRGSLIRVSAEWEMAPRVVHNSCPPLSGRLGGDGQCHGAGAGDCRWSLGGMVNSTGG